ncbi:MAG TPA: hypothetical protein VGM94_14335 [Galbitalea sp.]
MRHLVRSTFTLSFGIPFALFVLLDGFVLVTDLRWVGELGWTVDWANAGLFVSASLLAGLVAFVSNPFFASGFRQVAQADSGIARVRLFASVWLRNLVLGLAGHAVVVGVALAITASTGPTDAILPLAFVYALLPIVIFVTLGTLASAYAPSPLVSVLVVGLAYLLSYNAASAGLQLPLVVGGEEAGMVGLEFSTSSALVWAGVAFAITGILFVAGLLVALARRSSIAAGVTVLACLVAFAGPTLAGLHLPSRVETTGRPLALVCAGSAPRVCVARGHTRQLTRIAGRVDEATVPFRQAGVDFTGVSLEEQGDSYVPGKGILDLSSSDLDLGDFAGRDYVQALTKPRDCAALWGDRIGNGAGDGRSATSSTRLLDLADALTDWGYARLSPAGRTEPNSHHDDAWAHLAYTALAHCSVSSSLAATIKK